MNRQFTFCIAHKLPLVPSHLYDCAIGLGDYWPERGVHISELDPYWHQMRKLAYGAAGSYAVRNAVQKNACRTELTGIFTYRKILVRSANAVSLQSAREVSTTTCFSTQLADVQPQDDQQYLVAYPMNFPQSVTLHYSEWHHVIDLFEYISIATEFGILDYNEVNKFVQQTTLIPGGCELGIYPTIWLISTLEKLSLVGREFLSRHGTRIQTYDKYQVRSLGFLSERLGSYLLFKELHSRFLDGIPPSIFGEMYLIGPEGTCYSPGVADD